MKPNKIYIKGGIAKAYGDYDILKVDSIVIIAPMNGKTRKERQTQRDKKDKKKDFDKLLSKAGSQMTEGFDMRA